MGPQPYAFMGTYSALLRSPEQPVSCLCLREQGKEQVGARHRGQAYLACELHSAQARIGVAVSLINVSGGGKRVCRTQLNSGQHVCRRRTNKSLRVRSSALWRVLPSRSQSYPRPDHPLHRVCSANANPRGRVRTTRYFPVAVPGR